MVTAVKPKIGGAISTAPLGTTLPTSATAELAAAFENLGYVSDSGLVRSVDMDSNNVKAWGGDVVLVLDNGKTETFKFSMLNVTNIAVLKIAHGDDNVSGTALASGIAITSNNKERVGHAFVIDMIEKGSTLHRIVIPNGVVTDMDDISYVDNDALAYGVTITAIADDSGNTCYEYLKADVSGQPTSIELNTHAVSIVSGDTYTLNAVVIPVGSTVTWSSSNTDKVTVSNGTVTGEEAGNAIVTAAITVDGVTYNDTCTVIVTAA